MPFEVSATFNVADTLARLNYMQSQMPFAISLALNKTALAVKDAQVKEMIDVFDRPTPWTLNSVGTKPSDKTDLRAFVFLKDTQAVGTGTAADVYLTPQIKGGTRDLKRFEYAFRAAGILPSSYFMVPGEGATLDRYGNMARGQIVQILSFFDTFRQGGFSANMGPEGRKKLKQGTKTQAGYSYFAVQPGSSHLFPGIYQRATGVKSGGLKPILMFVSAAHYEAIYDFGFVGQTVVAERFPIELQSATQIALATAR